MAQLRRSNRRGSYENCQGHEITVLPATRKPAEDFCQAHHAMMVKMTDQRHRIRFAGKKVVQRASQANIDILKAEKDNLTRQKEMLMAHIITCEACK